ncbi:DNA photolyase family protein [Halobacillus salinarum]|uniref:DNA photolyase family protein n=1 Tax=Halobacillus salinarum TaxID=2932257 RepID=A0ABY4EMA6_9BACI|nr:deoxyribodipyrimidine photo-lyase [Halobacillus salinarum]UOQ45268.1 DNA photolyase family protein [Halobacillus salinarum]
MGTKVVWFRKDLRLNDHTALAKAIDNAGDNDSLLLIYQIHPALIENFTPRHDYYFQTLCSFVESCEELGTPLHFLYGEPEEAFNDLLKTEEVEEVYFNYDETGFGKRRDDLIIQWMENRGIGVFPAIDHHIHSAREVNKKEGGHYKVFSPYFKQWQQLDKPKPRKIDHEKLKRLVIDRENDFVTGRKRYEHLVGKCQGKWGGTGEKDALDRLQWFLEGAIYDYDEDRDFPAVDGTSLMSRYLRTGAISPRTVYSKVMEETDGRKQQKGIETYVQELAWRDFYNMIYYFYPDADDLEMVQKYRGLSWNEDEELFRAWKQGRTGFPLIDAAMRQLNETGWMHNRLRMAVASFLTKDLLMDWRLGERYFSEQLVDYDPASNIGGWQWAASTGTDPVPYFRVFNPTTQGERFDPHGRFIKEWVPELKDVPKKYIHEPGKMSDSDQWESSCVVGEDYPEPVVDHKTMRKRAIEMFKKET